MDSNPKAPPYQEVTASLRRLPLIIAGTMVLTAVLACALASAAGMFAPDILGNAALTLSCAAVLAALAATLAHWRILRSDLSANSRRLPQSLLVSFNREQPALYLASLVLPTALLYAGNFLSPSAAAFFLALHVTIGLGLAVPIYLHTQELLGSVAARYRLSRLQNTVRMKALLLGGLLPLLGGALLLEYFWWHSGSLPLAAVATWLAVSLACVVVSELAMRNVRRALRMARTILSSSEGRKLHALPDQWPANDEVGHLTQVLVRLFLRLKEQGSQVRAIVDTAAEGIIVTNAEGRIRSLNPAAERLFGHRNVALRGELLSRLVPGILTSNGHPRVLAGEQELEGVHRGGQRILVAVRVSEMELAGRRMYTCLVADITERKTAELMLRDAESRFRDLVETAHDLVWSMDMEGRWTYVNEASRAIYGYGPEEMTGRAVGEFSSPEHLRPDARAFGELRAGKDMVHYETMHLDRGGAARYLSFNGKALLDSDGKVVRITGTARDITAQKAYEQQLYYQAQHDTLTGLYNRSFFQQELERVISRVARSGSECALLYLDLDQFKYVNDTLGHAAGDRLLVECTAMLGAQLREGDLLARFGGDEFTILLYNIDTQHALQVAEKLRKAIESYRFIEDAKSFNIGCSMGVAMVHDMAESAEEVMSHADLACNKAKSRGRNCVVLYQPEQHELDGMAEDMGWAARVREAIEQDQLFLAYQPILSLKDGSLHGYEVLLRMARPEGGEILPGGFLPAAERFGLIHGIDRWTVQRAIKRLAQENRRTTHPVRFSINLSARAFDDDSLLALIQESMNNAQLDPSLVTFEITETAAITRMAAAVRFINQLKEIGCRFSLDDFGAGFCSFNYLKQLPVDTFKIDGSYVLGLADNTVDSALVRAMAQVAQALGRQTVAESVEDAATLDILRDLGVNYAQGYYIGRPQRQIVNPTSASQLIAV